MSLHNWKLKILGWNARSRICLCSHFIVLGEKKILAFVNVSGLFRHNETERERRRWCEPLSDPDCTRHYNISCRSTVHISHSFQMTFCWDQRSFRTFLFFSWSKRKLMRWMFPSKVRTRAASRRSCMQLTECQKSSSHGFVKLNITVSGGEKSSRKCW